MTPAQSDDPGHPDPTDIDATPTTLRNPDLAPGALSGLRGRPVSRPLGSERPDNNYASNGHWDRDDLGPIAYVPPVEAHEDGGPTTDAAGQAPAQQGGPATRKEGGR